MKHNEVRRQADTYTLPWLAWQHEIENNVKINVNFLKIERTLVKACNIFLTGKVWNNTEAKFLNLTDI